MLSNATNFGEWIESRRRLWISGSRLAKNTYFICFCSSLSSGRKADSTPSSVFKVSAAFISPLYSPSQRKVLPDSFLGEVRIKPFLLKKSIWLKEKSFPTPATKFTGIKKRAAIAKWAAEPPSISRLLPLGVLTVSRATVPRTTKLISVILFQKLLHIGREFL